jgi:hypothetical protein
MAIKADYSGGRSLIYEQKNITFGDKFRLNDLSS